MTPQELKLVLRGLAVAYAQKRSLPLDTSHASAVIFENIADSFHPDSYKAIIQNEAWLLRTKKQHQNLIGTLEMQSSNSSDALLMNYFCYPKINEWKGVQQLLGVSQIRPLFGFKALVAKTGTNGDASEIDLVLDDVFIEAKLTEEGFTKKKTAELERYKNLSTNFDVDCLDKVGDSTYNYQIIRNLLGSIQHDKRHILLCDARRPDLVRSYMETVSCLVSSRNRKKCKVVFWQELQSVCGKELSEFLQEKYGIC